LKNTTIVVIVVAIIVIVAGGAIATTSLLASQTSISISTSTTQSDSASTSTQTSTLVTSSSTTSSSSTPNSIGTARIGYFANVNHAPAIIGIANGTFQSFLGPSTKIQTSLFTSGTPEMTALLAGQLDIAYVGPDPAANAFVVSNGTALEIVSGVASGGALFVVTNTSGINSVANLGGKTFAAPGLGNTQDIALRSFLASHGYAPTTEGGNVTIDDTSNSNIVTLFEQNKIAGAWVPEPYASELIYLAGGHVFLDERSLWPNGQFSTAEIVVTASFLKAHPDVVEKVLEANLYEVNWINNNQAQAAVLLNNDIANLTSTSPLPAVIYTHSLTDLSFTVNPLESSVTQQAENAYLLGDLGTTVPNLSGIYNLTLLNEVLQQQGEAAITS
jgi:NitT/TauT family transport system substrate-binding protein